MSQIIRFNPYGNVTHSLEGPSVQIMTTDSQEPGETANTMLAIMMKKMEALELRTGALELGSLQLSGRIDDTEHTIGAVQKEQNFIGDQTESLKLSQVRTSRQVDLLTEVEADLDQRVKEKGRELAGLNEGLANVGETVSLNQKEIKRLTSESKELRSGNETLENKQDGLSADVSGLQRSVGALQGRTTENENMLRHLEFTRRITAEIKEKKLDTCCAITGGIAVAVPSGGAAILHGTHAYKNFSVANENSKLAEHYAYTRDHPYEGASEIYKSTYSAWAYNSALEAKKASSLAKTDSLKAGASAAVAVAGAGMFAYGLYKENQQEQNEKHLINQAEVEYQEFVKTNPQATVEEALEYVRTRLG